MPEQLLDVIDPESGEQFSIAQSQYDPARFQLVPGQQLAVSASDVAPAGFGLEATAEELGAPQVQRRLGAQELADMQAQAAAESMHGGLGTQAGQAVRGAVSSLMLGASEALLGTASTSLEREELRSVRGAGPGFEVGQVVGDVATAVAPGGALKWLPGGMTAKAAETIAAKGMNRGLAREMAAGAAGLGLDGAAQGAANYIAHQSIQEDPAFSGSALASSMGSAALFGAGLGGASTAARRGMGALTDLMARGERGGSATGHALGELGEAEVQAAARELGDVAAPKGTFSYRRMIPEADRAAAKIGSKASKVVAQVGESERVLGLARKEAREIFRMDRMTAAGDDAAQTMRAEVSAALQQYGDAVGGARRWQRNWTRTLKPEELAGGKLPKMGDDLAEDAVLALGGVDDAAVRLEDAMGRARQMLAPELVAAAEAKAAAKAAARPAAKPDPPSPGIGQRAADLAGVAQMAGEAGLPVPDLGGIPVVGEALSAYLKFRMARNALSRAGLVAATPAARSAVKVADFRNLIDRAVRAAGSKPARVAARVASKAGARAVESTARMARDLGAATASDVEGNVSAELRGLPEDVISEAQAAAVRQMEYLQANIPQGPGAGTVFADPNWRPSEREALAFDARSRATLDPGSALADLLSPNWRPYSSEQLDAVRTVHPALWQATQQQLVDRAEEIAKTWSRPTRTRIGRQFGVPLVSSQQPQYQTLQAPEMPPGEAQGSEAKFAAPSVNSKAASMNATAPERRAMGGL